MHKNITGYYRVVSFAAVRWGGRIEPTLRTAAKKTIITGLLVQKVKYSNYVLVVF